MTQKENLKCVSFYITSFPPFFPGFNTEIPRFVMFPVVSDFHGSTVCHGMYGMFFFTTLILLDTVILIVSYSSLCLIKPFIFYIKYYVVLGKI